MKKVRLTNYFHTNINEGSRIVSNEPPFAADASPRSCFAMCPINIVSTNPEWFLYHIEIAKLVATLIATFICALFFCAAIRFMLLLTNITDCIVTHSIIPIGHGTHVNDIINWKNNVPLVEVNATPFPESRWQLSFFFLCNRELNYDHQLVNKRFGSFGLISQKDTHLLTVWPSSSYVEFSCVNYS